MSEVNVQIQNPQQTVSINNPSIVIEVAEDSFQVEFSEQNVEIQVQSPVIEVNIGGPCNCNGGGGTWGSITGTLSDQTDLQTALDGKVDENAAITGATKTKITYDAKGLVTAGTDAAIADITGLQTALDGKSNTGHGHTFADISSGTFAATAEATMATGENFAIKYSNNAEALLVSDANGNARIFSSDGSSELSLSQSGNAALISSHGEIDLFAAGLTLYDYRAGAAAVGYEYDQDYSANYTDRSLVDKAFVLANAGGGASVTEITYADMQTAITNSTLTPGAWYLITDAAGTDLGFLTNAVNENTINVQGVGGYLNADFQAVGDYSGTPETFNAQLGIWRTGFEEITIPYTNLTPDYVSYSTSSGLLTAAETFTTNLGTTGEVITDDGAGTATVQNLSQALVAGEIITGDTSTNTVTVDAYTNPAFAVGDTITGGSTFATAVIVTDDGASSMTAYMTSAGISFDGSEVLDNGNGVTADQDGAATSPTIVQGDVVIWNLLHWQLIDATLLDGTDPATNTAAYTLLDKATYPETYITAWDVSEFDFVNQWLQYRADNRGNKVFLSYRTEQDLFGNGITAVSVFQFGRQATYGNTVSDGFIDIQNILTSGFSSNNFYPGASVLNCFFGQGVYVQYNSLFQGAILDTLYLGNNTEFIGNTLYPFSAIQEVYIGSNGVFNSNLILPAAKFLNITSDSGVVVQNNILENGASLTGITAGANCSISRNKIGQGATLGGSTTMGNGSELNDNNIGGGSSISGLNLIDGGVSDNTLLGSNSSISNISTSGGGEGVFGSLLIKSALEDCTFSGGGKIEGATLNYSTLRNKTVTNVIEAFSFNNFNADDAKTLSGVIYGNTVFIGLSTFDETIDITGLTTLDCLAENNYVGIFNLTSSNATETLDTITNPPTLFPFTLRPAAGVVLTITGTAYSGIAAGQIALKATDYVLDGDKGEYIVLEIDPLGTGALIEKQVVNGII